MNKIQQKIFSLAITMLLSIASINPAVAAGDNSPVDSGGSVNKENCEKGGGTFSKDADGGTTCAYPSGDLITCGPPGPDSDMCEKCTSEPGREGCGPIFPGQGLLGQAVPIISGQGVNNSIVAAPKELAPTRSPAAVAIPESDPQLAIVAVKQKPLTSTAVAPSNQNAQMLRSSVQSNAPARLDAGQRAGAGDEITAVPLTKGECEVLGGTVGTLAICDSGKACSTTDEKGKTHTVCTEAKVVKETGNDSGSQVTPAASRFDQAMPQTGSTMAVPLTSGECKGLGGKLIMTNGCIAKGQATCATVDKDGVVRATCINEASK